MIEIVIGIISGFVSAMGMGGGTILILLLSLILHFDQHVAQATNLLFFIPTAIAAIIIGIRNRNILWKEALPIILSGMIGATISAMIGSTMNVEVLRKLFGVFLLIIAMYEIYSWYKMYIKTKIRHNNNK